MESSSTIVFIAMTTSRVSGVTHAVMTNAAQRRPVATVGMEKASGVEEGSEQK